LCPSSVWFIARFDVAATPRAFDSGVAAGSSRSTLSSPSSPPAASQPCSGFHVTERSFVLFGIATFLERNA
jgi:hypothetical protein